MATGSSIVTQLTNAGSAPTTGLGAICEISFGGAQVLQAVENIYLEVDLNDPTNTGAPATFELNVVGGIQSTNTTIGTITATGLATLSAPAPITYWRVDLVSLSGGVAPTVTVRGVVSQ